MCTGRDLIAGVGRRGTVDICRKQGFPGQPCVYTTTCALGPCMDAGCASATWVSGGSRGNDMGAGRRCLAQRGGGVSWSGPPHNGACMSGRCASGNVEGWATQCLPTVRGRTCVDAWAGAASGGSFGLLRRWPSEVLHGYCVENRYIKETFLTLRTLRVARS